MRNREGVIMRERGRDGVIIREGGRDGEGSGGRQLHNTPAFGPPCSLNLAAAGGKFIINSDSASEK